MAKPLSDAEQALHDAALVLYRRSTSVAPSLARRATS